MSDVGFQDGVEATRLALGKVDPDHTAAFNKLWGEPGAVYDRPANRPVEGTIKKLIDGHNRLDEYEARIAALERSVAMRPFG